MWVILASALLVMQRFSCVSLSIHTGFWCDYLCVPTCRTLVCVTFHSYRILVWLSLCACLCVPTYRTLVFVFLYFCIQDCVSLFVPVSRTVCAFVPIYSEMCMCVCVYEFVYKFVCVCAGLNLMCHLVFHHVGLWCVSPLCKHTWF